MKKVLLSISIAAILATTGCESFNEDINKQQEKVTNVVEGEVELAIQIRENAQRKYRYIRHNKKIFVPPIVNEDLVKPNWWFDDLENGKGRNIPLIDAITMVMDERPVNIKYEDGINKQASVTYQGKTVGDALESISHASGYSFAIQQDNVITWSKFKTKSFPIASIPTKFSFGLGKKSGSSNSSNENVSSGDEFALATATDLDPLQELLDELKTYSSFKDVNAKASTGEDGIAKADDDIPIFLNRSASTITVRDVPHIVDQMEDIIKKRNQIYRTQVQMDIEIIQVKLDNEAVDSWDVQVAINKATSASLALTAGAVGSTGTPFTGRFSKEATFGVGASVKKGALTGTGALIELLNRHGSVTTHTMPRVIAHHNSIAKLRDLDRIKYIAERSTTSTSNVGVEQSISQENLDVGFSMYAIPTVFESDVSIAMATNISTLIELVRNGDSGIPEESGTATYVESPYTTDKDFFNRFTVRSGDTVFFAGLSRTSKQIRTANAGHDALGFSDYAENERVETIIAVTPRIIRPSAI